MSHEESSAPPHGAYWYDSKKSGVFSAMQVLWAVRRFRVADSVMRHRAQVDMHVNETDLSAIRHLIASERQDQAVSPKNLSEFLNISSAATAKLLSRLSSSGHIRREVNPEDGRAQRLYATDSSHQEIRRTLSSIHEQMMQVALELTVDQQETVVHFLDAMSAISVGPPPEPESALTGVLLP
jgi:DNA-binding MarR family transcriptional regulator